MPSEPHTGSCGVVSTGHVRGQLLDVVTALFSLRFTGISDEISAWKHPKKKIRKKDHKHKNVFFLNFYK